MLSKRLPLFHIPTMCSCQPDCPQHLLETWEQPPGAKLPPGDLYPVPHGRGPAPTFSPVPAGWCTTEPPGKCPTPLGCTSVYLASARPILWNTWTRANWQVRGASFVERHGMSRAPKHPSAEGTQEGGTLTPGTRSLLTPSALTPARHASGTHRAAISDRNDRAYQREFWLSIGSGWKKDNRRRPQT